MKYHVKANGEPGVCTAQEGNCPFGSDAPHFDTKDDAWRHSVENLRKQYGSFNTVKKAEKTPDVYESNRSKYSKIFSEVAGTGELTRESAIAGVDAAARAMRDDLNLESPNLMRPEENPDGSKDKLFTHELSVNSTALNLKSDEIPEEGKELIMEQLRRNGVDNPEELDDLRFVVRSTVPRLTRRTRVAQSTAQIAFAKRRGVSDAAKIFREAYRDFSSVKPKVLMDESLDSLSSKEFAHKLGLPWRS